jgi:hypothetical protein
MRAQPLSYASPRFLLLLGYRVVELSSRTLALTYTAVMAPVAVAVAFVAHCGFVKLVGASPQSRHAVVPGAMYSDTAFTRSWQVTPLVYPFLSSSSVSCVFCCSLVLQCLSPSHPPRTHARVHNSVVVESHHAKPSSCLLTWFHLALLGLCCVRRQ